LCPKRCCNEMRLDTNFPPPSGFVAASVDFTVVNTTERYRELVAHLATERTRLGGPKMMRITGLATADQTGL
jgi:hypothetical protein